MSGDQADYGEVRVPSAAELQTMAAAAVTYVAACQQCPGEDTTAEPSLMMPVPFATADERDKWASVHADTRGHTVTIGEQQPGVGTTIKGVVAPDRPATGVARPPTPPPLLAFVVPAGGEPNLMCQVPNRAGAAWLAYAAHACLLGHQGSAGIPEPHRVMFIGRVTAPTPHHGWGVRIDGVIGATGKSYGRAIGDVYGVTREADLPTVEDAVETLLDDEYRFGRHTFSVLLVTDAPTTELPDPGADAALRAGTGEQAVTRPGPDGACCDQHNRHCEPPAELCCAGCGEVMHPAHPIGVPCVLDGQ